MIATTVEKAMGGLKRGWEAPLTLVRRWRYDRALRKAGISEAFIAKLTDERRRRVPAQAWGAEPAWRQRRALRRASEDATVPQWLLDHEAASAVDGAPAQPAVRMWA